MPDRYGYYDVASYMGGYPIVLFIYDTTSRDLFPLIHVASTQAAADRIIAGALACGAYRIDQYGP